MQSSHRVAAFLFAVFLAAGGVEARQSALASETAVQDAAPQSPNEGEGLLEQKDLDAWLDGFLPYALETGDIAGAVVVVVSDGEVLSQRGYGYADVERRRPVDPERTLFRPGSVSKLLTWTAVMQLVERGKLDLDRDVNAYLDFPIPPKDGEPVTLRQVLTHTGGFEESLKNLIFFDVDRLPSLGEYVQAWVPRRIFAPGTTPAYSNYATALAGYVVERVSGLPFDDYMEENLFGPLGMNRSTFRQPLPEHLTPLMSQGYHRASGEAVEFEIVGPAPAGSLSSTGADMAKFMIAHLQQGEFRGARILQAETARQMHDSRLAFLPPLNGMELGFFETNINNRQVIAHLGDTGAFHTALHLFLEEDVGLYLSTNSSGRNGAAGNVRSALFQDFADRYFPAEDASRSLGAEDSLPEDIGSKNAEKLAGVWVPSRRSESNFFAIASLLGQVEVEVGPEGELVIPSLPGLNGKPRNWVEVAPFVWVDPDSHERLAAEVADGEVVRWSIDLLAPFTVFERVPAAKSSTFLFPAVVASVLALALTFVLWPVAALVRRHYGAALALVGPERTAYRAVRILAGLTLAVLAGWLAAITSAMGNLDRLTSAMDPWWWVLQSSSLVVFVGGLAVALWNGWLAFRRGRKWTSKLWSIVLVLASASVLWTAIAYQLLAFTVDY